MEKSKSLALAVLFAGLSVFALGQEIKELENPARYKHAIGAGAGFTTGYGLSYRYLHGKFGGQINFAPYHNNETTRYSAGLTFLYKIIEGENTNLYLYQGNHFYYNSQMTYIYPIVKGPGMPTPEPTYERVTESYMNNGVGIGIEFIIIKRIALNLMGGYASYRNFSQINFTGEAALYYRF
jgi:hypothetical protein